MGGKFKVFVGYLTGRLPKKPKKCKSIKVDNITC